MPHTKCQVVTSCCVTSARSHIPQAEHLMDTQGHTCDRLPTMELLTMVLPARVLLPCVVHVIMELCGAHVRHDISRQTILFLQCANVGSAARTLDALTLALGRGHQLLSLTLPCQNVAMAGSETHAYC